MTQAPPNIGSRTLRGMLWAFASYGGGRVLVLIATAVLARILTPDEFGLVAAALTIISLFDSVAHLGLGQALIIQDDDVVQDRAETAFVGTIAIGFLVAVAVGALSPLIADFFDQPELVGISIALGANFFVRSFGITHYSLAQRSLDFRARTAAEIADAVFRGVAGIALALAGFGAWSLVIGYLVGTIAHNIAIWRMVPWRPNLRPQRAHLGELVRFGGTLTAVDVMAGLIGNVDYVFVGRVLGAASLGAYQIAYVVPRTAITNLAVVAGKVLFPAFAAYDRADMRRPFLVSVRYVWMLAIPGSLLIAILAEPMVEVIFGDQWGAAVGPMRIFALLGLTAAIGFPAGTAYKATGRPAVLLILAVARFIILLVGLILFVHLGLNAAAACATGAAVVVEAVNLVLASRLLDTPLKAIWVEVAPSLAGAAAMAGPVLAVALLVDVPLLALVLGVAAGLGAYAAVLRVVAPDAVAFLRRRLVPQSPQPPAVDA